MYNRLGVLNSNTISLKAVFVDSQGNFVDTTSLPAVYIYDSSLDIDTIESEVDSGLYTSALAGPFTPVKLDTGFYVYEYTVPTSAEAGVWRDVWVGDIVNTSVSNILTFTVINGADVSEQRLLDNELIIVELDKSIAGYSGQTLGVDIQIAFLTTLNPFYASVDLIRMEAGPWIDFIPDATIATMIHLSSKEAQFITPSGGRMSDRMKFARSRFVTFDALVRAFTLPGSFTNQPGGVLGSSKRLGDLSITNGNGAIVARTASGIDLDTLKYFKEKRSEWWRVVNANAEINPGQSLGFEVAQKGRFDPDRRMAGRQWADPDLFHYEQPGTNHKGIPYGYRKGKHYWRSTRNGTYQLEVD